jgi:phosphohistidine phosphatase
MRTLILLRHAKAVSAHEAESDRVRGLTGRGRREAALAGAAMKEAGLKPALALVSTAQRTRETAEHALAGFALETRFDDALYHASPEATWNVFKKGGAESAVIVGHNPGLAELAAMLVRQAHDNSKLAREVAGHFPTAAFVAFTVDGDVLKAAAPRLIAAWKPERD